MMPIPNAISRAFQLARCVGIESRRFPFSDLMRQLLDLDSGERDCCGLLYRRDSGDLCGRFAIQS